MELVGYLYTLDLKPNMSEEEVQEQLRLTKIQAENRHGISFPVIAVNPSLENIEDCEQYKLITNQYVLRNHIMFLVEDV